MPTGRFWLSAGVANGILYAVGGANGSSPVATVEAYDPSTNTWATKASMPTARYGLGVGVVNGILYAVGGASGSSNFATVEAYDPSTNTWTTKASMPTGRGYLGVGVVNGVLYALGGFGNGSYLTVVEAYDPSTNTWTTKAPMPIVRDRMGVGVVNGILYSAGGGNIFNFTLQEAFTPPTLGDKCLEGDINGDGKTDFWCYQSSGNWTVTLMNTGTSDLLTSISNGIGGNTTVSYKSSSEFWTSTDTNWNFPFIRQSVSSITVCDNFTTSCDGNSTITNYTYSGAYYNGLARESRGFASVKITNAINNNTTQTFYHQGPV